jgi:hypothetical protein
MELTATQCRTLFTDFCRKQAALNNISPHLIMVGESCRQLSLSEEETVWRGGLYAATYNYPAAEVLWQNWAAPSVVLRSKSLQSWLKENWLGVPLRRERKCVRTPAKLARCLQSFAAWMRGDGLKRLYGNGVGYDDAWEIFQEVYGMGRYITIRFLEFLHRYADLRPVMYNSMPREGQHSRKGLALLYPEYKTVLLGSNSWGDCKESDKLACRELARLREAGVYYSHYQLATMLCEFKQALLGGHLYPGKAIDSEMKYQRKVLDYWGKRRKSQFMHVRTVFPKETRGEVQGWTEERKPLLTVLRDYGYNWSDQDYDYAKTRDFSNPVRRVV